MTGLEELLVAVAANLVSGGLIGAAKASWMRFKETLVKKGDRRIDAWLDLLEADPSEKLAREVAERIRAMGLDKDPDVQRNTVEVRSQLAIGHGATSATVVTNNGIIGGNHFHIGLPQALSISSNGGSFFHIVNTTSSTVVVNGVRASGLDRLEILAPLPMTLQPGAGLPLIADAALGAGDPQVMVQVARNGTASQELVFIPSKY